jgi:replicative DNA helicase
MMKPKPNCGLFLLYKALEAKDIDTITSIDYRRILTYEEQLKYNEIIEFVSRYSELPPASIINLDDDEERLCAEYPVEYWKDMVTLRLKALSLSKIKQILSIPEISPDDAYNKIENIIRTHQLYDTEDVTIGFSEFKDLVLKYRIRSISRRISGIPTGWPSLDFYFDGYQKSEVYVFCGRPKTGKTMLLVYSANHAIDQKYKVMFVSTELSRSRILARFVAERAKLNIRSALKLNLDDFALKKYEEACYGIDNFILVGDKLRRDTSSIASAVIRHNPDILFIDGAYLLKPKKTRSDTGWEAVAEVVNEIKELAMSFNIPVVISYQFNRQTNSKKIALSNIAYGDSVGQIAGGVVGLKEDTESLQREVVILANRDGEIGSFLINWDFKNMDFSEVKRTPLGKEEDDDIIYDDINEEEEEDEQ